MNHTFSFYVLPSLLVLAAGFIILMTALVVLSFTGAVKTTRYKTITVILAVFVTLSILEFMLRITGLFATYMEKRSGYYWSPYDYNRDNVLWNRDSGQSYFLSSQDFRYPRKANSLGFVDKEFSEKKDSDEVKILCLGDSFTEGDGSPEDSCYPRALERILRARYPQKKITVMNGGICGSDPIFGYKIYDSVMYRFRPDIVIQLFSKQDFNEDIAFRGGFERYGANGKLHFTNTFPYEKLYQLSYLSRIYFTNVKGYNFLFVNGDLLTKKQTFFVEQACLLGKKWEAEITKRPFQLYLVAKPDVWDVNQNGYEDWFKEIIAGFHSCSPRAKMFDLNRYFIDSSGMQKNVNEYFWMHDGHNTPKGYQEMAKGIASQLEL